MATSAEAVRGQLAVVTAAVAQEVSTAAAQVAVERQAGAALAAVNLIVPAYYDAAGSLAVAWYDEIRDESRPSGPYEATIIGDPATEWIEREAARLLRDLDTDLEAEMQSMTNEIIALAAKEVARGFRDSITGNARMDTEAIGWSRVARGGACRFCRMLADKGAVYRSESTAIFGAHKNCNCAARPEFANGEHGPEANVMQYLASTKNRTPEQQYKLKKYLHENYGGPAPRPLTKASEKDGAIAEGRALNAPRLDALNDLLAGLGGN